MPAQASFGNLRRSPLVILGFLIFFVVAAYQTADYVIVGDMTGLVFVALAFTAGALGFRAQGKLKTELPGKITAGLSLKSRGLAATRGSKVQLAYWDPDTRSFPATRGLQPVADEFYLRQLPRGPVPRLVRCP